MQLVYNNEIKIPNKVDLKNYDKKDLIFFIQTLKSEVRQYRKLNCWTKLN